MGARTTAAAARADIGDRSDRPRRTAIRARGTGAAASEDFSGVRRLFDSFKKDAHGNVSRLEVMTRLQQAGIGPDDSRARDFWGGPEDREGEGQRLDLGQF